MKLTQDDKLLLLEGRLKEAITASRRVRQGKYPSGEMPDYIAALGRQVKAAAKVMTDLR